MSATRPSNLEPQAGRTEARPKKHRGRIIVIGVLAAAAAIVGLAPKIAGLRPLQRQIFDYAGDRVGARMTASDLSLSWFGRQAVSGLSVDTLEGKEAARIADFSLDEGLLSLLFNRTYIGPVAIQDGEIQLDNLLGWSRAMPVSEERPVPSGARAPATEKAPPEGTLLPLLPVKIQIRRLKLKARDATIHVAQANFQTGSPSDAFDAQLEFDYQNQRGTGTVKGTIEGLSTNWQGPEAIGLKARADTTNVPLSAIAQVLAALDVPLELGGTLSGGADVDRNRAGKMTVQANYTAQNVWASGEALHGDRPELKTVTLATNLTLAGDTLTVQTFRLDSPVATAQAQGTFVAPFAVAAEGAAAPAASGTADLSLQIAPIARMLPNTLGLQKDTEVTSGLIQAQLQMQTSDAGAALQASAVVKDLAGLRKTTGQQIALAPINLKADILRGKDETQVKEVVATSSFGTLQGSGTLNAFALDANLDLAKAAQEVGQFVDLGGMNAAGALTATVKTTAAQGGAVSLDARIQVTDFVLDLGGGRQWHEPKAVMTALANLDFDDQHRLIGINAQDVRVGLAAGIVNVDGTLNRKADTWDLKGHAVGAGDLAVLSRQVSGYLGRKGSDLAGRWFMETSASGTPGQSLAATVKGGTTNLAYVAAPATEGGQARPIPVKDLALAADLLVQDRGQARDIAVQKLQVDGEGIAVHAGGKVTTLEGAGSEGTTLQAADGQADARFDLAKISGLLGSFGVLAPGSTMAGTASFSGTATSKGTVVSGGGTLNLADVDVFLPDTGTRINEPKATVPIAATYSRTTDTLDLVLDKIQSALATGTVKGTIQPRKGAVNVNASAALDLDGKRLRQAVGNQLPSDFAMGGAWNLAAKVSGPISTGNLPAAERFAKLSGDGVLKIGTFTFRGTEGSEGEIVWTIGDGTLHVTPDPKQPSDLSVNQGTVSVAGDVNLAKDPPEFTVSKPLQMAKEVRLTGAMADEILAYVSPLVGGSVTPTGRVSMNITSADLPMGAAAAEKGTFIGDLTIDDFRSTLKGPLAVLAGWLGVPAEVKQQKFGPVPINLKDGLFYLDNQVVTLQGGAKLLTSGTIRVKDGEMNLMVLMPLTESVLSKVGVKTKTGGLLVDRVVRIPVTGTIGRPRLDESKIPQAIMDSVKDLFGLGSDNPLKEIGDTLKDLFGKPKP